MTFLAGKPAPPRPTHHHHHHHHRYTNMSTASSENLNYRCRRLSPRPRNMSPPPHHRDPNSTPHLIDSNLHMFREALTNSRRSASQTGSDLCTFISGEMARHGSKRSASPSDVPMGSPTHPKRSKFM